MATSRKAYEKLVQQANHLSASERHRLVRLLSGGEPGSPGLSPAAEEALKRKLFAQARAIVGKYPPPPDGTALSIIKRDRGRL